MTEWPQDKMAKFQALYSYRYSDYRAAAENTGKKPQYGKKGSAENAPKYIAQKYHILSPTS